NKGGGHFEIVTPAVAPDLQSAGFVKNGAWADMDMDGDQDLVLALEWDPLCVFLNNGGKFERKNLASGSGWWNFVLPYDFDGDGDVDLLAGNTGTNSRLKPGAKEPVHLYVNDFDGNGQTETVMTYYVKGREIPFSNYEEMTKALPIIKKHYLLASNFAKASAADLLGKEKMEKSIVRTADAFESVYLENIGPGLNFKVHVLPDELQWSTLNATALADLDGDGRKEVILGGNFYECNIEMGRYDNNYGNVLSIGKDGAMQVAPLGDLRIKGQVRRIRPVTIKGQICFILARNDEACLVIRPAKSPRVQ
ncbi:MAG TPA: VCBS repeat-containing protein, partial [Saprospiraceae bacterium]|nr:VCBS repeat-containing protein [Saprospiraceae bacterium]